MVVPARVVWSPASCSGLRRPSTTWLVSTVVSRPLGSAIALSRVALSSAANASFVGANTVTSLAVLRVSPSPASPTALTRVESTGLLLAAVATGSAAMPANEPAPSAGTAAQPGPNGALAMSELIDSEGLGAADELIGALDEGPLPASERGRARARAAIVRRLLRMGLLLVL